MSRWVDFARRAGEVGGTFLSELRRARGLGDTSSRQTENPMSSFVDDMVTSGLGYREHHLGTFDVLRRVRDQLPPLGAIIETRTKQVISFAKPCRNRFETGYRIVLRDEKETASRGSDKTIKQLTKFVELCGVPDDRHHRDSFPVYMAKVAQDALLYAQDATEIVPDKQGNPAASYAVDSSTIRLSSEDKPFEAETNDDITAYIQLVQGIIKNRYTREQMIFGVQNPTSDIRFMGYGVSPIERAMRVCSAMLNTWETNHRQYQGVTSRGIFNLPKANNRMLSDFRQRMQVWMQGLENTATVPAVSIDDGLQYIDLSRTMQDMQFAQWWNVLLRLLCAFYAIEPSEVNFEMAQVGLQQAISTPSNEQKVIESRERGLVPLLTHFAANLNAHIIHKLDPNFSLEFVGLDSMTREQRQAYNASRLQTTHTLNEIRAEEDMETFPEEIGDIIYNPFFMQQKQAAEQPQQQAGFFQPQQSPGDDQAATADDNQGQAQESQAEGPLQRSYRWRLET